MVCAMQLSAIAQTAPSPKTTTQSPTQALAPKDSSSYGQRSDVQKWAKEMASRQTLDPQWVRMQLNKARFLPQVPRLMTPSPTVTTTARDWRDYRSRFIDKTRIRAGVKFWNDNADTLARAEEMFGVPATIIVGIIGVETIYGQHMGNLRVLDSLSTLAFDFPRAHPRAAERQKYFQGELEQFLVMMYHADTDPTGPRGSYAGAMGLGQFMPTSWSQWAIDFDRDGRIDLFQSTSDAIGSVANYLKAHGWINGQPVWYAPAFNLDTLNLPTLLEPDIRPTFSSAQMAAMGVTPQDGANHEGLLALVELRNGDTAPSYIVGTQNFYTITRYNWSSYYAMAVYDLGQEVAAARNGVAPAIAQPAVIPVPQQEP